MTETDGQMASIRELVEKHKKKAAKAAAAPRKRSGSGASAGATEENKKDIEAAAPIKEVIVDGGD